MTLEMELEFFAKFIHKEYTDEYGHLLLGEESDGEFCITSYREAAQEFITQRERELKL